MLKILRITLAIIAVVLGIYGIITHNSAALPYELFLLGTLSLISGVSELHQKRNSVGIIYIFVAAFLFYVVIQTTLFR